MKISGKNITLDQMLMAMAVDCLNFLCWTKTKEAQKGRNKPKRIIDTLMVDEKKDEYVTFETPEEYLEYVKRKKEG